MNDNNDYTLEQLLETCMEELEMLRLVLSSNGISDQDVVDARRLFTRNPS